MRTIDADALKKQIQDFHCKGCDNYNFVRCRACWVDDTLSYLDEAPTVGEWINVDDQLPGKSQIVLVSLVNEIDGHRMKTPQIGYHTGDEGRMWFIVSWNEWATASDFMVTHWMPMPEAPKEDE